MQKIFSFWQSLTEKWKNNETNVSKGISQMENEKMEI